MSGWPAARSDARDARVLAATELRTRVRDLRGNPRRLLAVGFLLALFGVVVPLTMWQVATGFGRRLASGAVPLGTTGAVFAATGSVGLYLGGASGFTQEAAGAVGPLVRTSVPPTAVSLGRLASETVQGVALVVPIAVGLAVEVAVGGGPVPAVLLALAALPVLAVSLLTGRLLGAALRYANRVLRVSLWTKALLFVAVTVGAYAGTYAVVSAEFDGGARPGARLLPPFLPGEPLQAYASVALAPLGATPRPLGLLVAAALLGAVPLALLAAVRAETWLLLREPGSAERDGTRGAAESRGVPRPFAATPSGRVAWRHLLRTRRDPRTLAHLGPLLFGALGMGASVFRDPGSLLAVGPASAFVGGAILAGAAYCLNPLGDDRDQLPLLLTSIPSAAVLLRGRALAGLALGLAVAVGIGTPLGLARGNLVLTAAEAALAVALAAAGAGAALGVGALVPRFERREYMSVERAHPSMLGLLGFFFGWTIVGGVGVALLWWTSGGASPLLAAVAWAGYLAVLAGAGGGGYVYAVRRFDRLTLDDV